MPPALSRPLRKFTRLGKALLVVNVIPYGLALLDACHVVELHPTQLRAMFLVYFCSLPLACGILVLGKYLTIRGVRELTRNAHCELCTQCGYPLLSLPERHACPECGVAYDIDEVRREWQRWFGGKRKKEKERGKRKGTSLILDD